GYIAGYRVGGKTGTSEKLPRGSGKYIASFVGIAPTDDPKIAVIVMLDDPDSFSYYGNAIAAPVAREIIDDTLQYMGVEPQYSAKESISDNVNVPSVVGLSLENAKNTAVDAGFDYMIIGDGKKVEQQVPSANSMVTDGSTIILYTTGSSKQKITVPDVTGLTPAQAQYNLNMNGLNYSFSDIAPNLKNNVTATSQSPEAGTEVEVGATVTVNFIQESAD
ncbi:MAG: PASTA domain-containing protein, partial [Clostridia bacterium]|nr:PASTA domain-containing protein [Clostridia bacterium]